MNAPGGAYGMQLAKLPAGTKLIGQLETLDEHGLARWIVEQGGAWSVVFMRNHVEATVQLRDYEHDREWKSEREIGTDRRSAMLKALQRLLPRLA